MPLHSNLPTPQVIDNARSDALKSRFAMIPVSAQRWAIIEDNGIVVTTDFVTRDFLLVGYPTFRFIEGLEKLTFAKAREEIIRLRREEMKERPSELSTEEWLRRAASAGALDEDDE